MDNDFNYSTGFDLGIGPASPQMTRMYKEVDAPCVRVRPRLNKYDYQYEDKMDKFRREQNEKREING